MTLSTEDFVMIRGQARLLLGLTSIAWIIHLVNSTFKYRSSSGDYRYPLNEAFGLRPRTPWGLVGIVGAPFLHSSWRHLMGNTRAFLILGWFIAMQGMHLFYVVTIAITLIGGLLTWLIADGRLGVGASILVYGYIGFLLVYGLTAGDGVSLLLAILVGMEYRHQIIGWTIRGTWICGWLSSGDRKFDRRIGNSGCYGHFSGLMAGIITAYFLSSIKALH